jgi:hypothetical protein
MDPPIEVEFEMLNLVMEAAIFIPKSTILL